jgi:hypothetical protein
VSLTLPASAQIFDTSFMVTGSWDESNLVRPFVYYPPNSSLEVWKQERLKICGMLSSRSGAFQINGKDVNAASHATYSHDQRNNELIMREGLEIYEPEGIEWFVEDVHIHRNYFNNEADWREPSPYDNLLSTQHQEMLLIWAIVSASGRLHSEFVRLYSYRIIGKLTVFLQFQEFSLRKPTVTNSTSAVRHSPHTLSLGSSTSLLRLLIYTLRLI